MPRPPPRKFNPYCRSERDIASKNTTHHRAQGNQLSTKSWASYFCPLHIYQVVTFFLAHAQRAVSAAGVTETLKSLLCLPLGWNSRGVSQRHLCEFIVQGLTAIPTPHVGPPAPPLPRPFSPSFSSRRCPSPHHVFRPAETPSAYVRHVFVNESASIVAMAAETPVQRCCFVAVVVVFAHIANNVDIDVLLLQ